MKSVHTTSKDGVTIDGDGKLSRRRWLAQLSGLVSGSVLASTGCRKAANVPGQNAPSFAGVSHDALDQLCCLKAPTGMVKSVALSPDGRFVLSGGVQMTSRGGVIGATTLLWDVERGKLLRRFRGHNSIVRAVTFSPDGQQALTASQDGTTRLWDVTHGRQLHCFWQTEEPPEIPLLAEKMVNAVTFFPDGRQALTGGDDGTLRVLDLERGVESCRLTAHVDTVWSVALSGDGRFAVTGGGGIETWNKDGPHELRDCTVRLWDLSVRKEVRRLEGHTDVVQIVFISPDARRILSASPDKTIRHWDAATGKELRRLDFRVSQVHSLAFSSDGRRLLTGEGELKMIGEEEAEGIHCTVRLWDVETGAELHHFEGHTSEVVSVAFSGDGKKAASAGGLDESIRVWRLPS